MTNSLTLALEGSTYEGSVALIQGGEVIAENTLHDDDGGIPVAGRGERLLPAVAECIEAAGAGAGEIRRIVCGAGPGRFTSLRVAGAVAKGLATGYGAELYAISSLLLTVSAARPPLGEGEYLSVVDAMRGDWFAARVTIAPDGSVEQDGPAWILSGADLGAISRAEPNLQIAGPGQRIDARPHARGVTRLLSRIATDGPVDIASWEPDYGRLPEAEARRASARERPSVR